jgi:hypothetical protein
MAAPSSTAKPMIATFFIAPSSLSDPVNVTY